MITDIELVNLGRSNRGPYDIYNCETGYDYTRLPDMFEYRDGVYYGDPIDTLINLGVNIVYMRKTLIKLGYPKSVWQPLLLLLEKEQLTLRMREMGKWQDSLPSEQHYDAFVDKIARELNSYRQRKAPRLPKVVSDGGCGDGGFGIKVMTEPANGQVMFITVFFYELCRAQNLDPNDPTQCDRWREAVAGAEFEVSGDYFYRASWPSGAERRGRLSFTNIERDMTITFREPKVERGKRTQ
jgi:hypothetical protein